MANANQMPLVPQTVRCKGLGTQEGDEVGGGTSVTLQSH